MRHKRIIHLVFILTLFVQAVMVVHALGAEKVIGIGSKKFTENVLLAEILGQYLEHNGMEYHHRSDLGDRAIRPPGP